MPKTEFTVEVRLMQNVSQHGKTRTTHVGNDYELHDNLDEASRRFDEIREPLDADRREH
jgi:hypothetical protein